MDDDILEKQNVSVPVIDPKFCMPHTMHLVMKPKKGMFNNTLFDVFDAHGNQLLKIVKGDSLVMSRDRLILDAATDSPVATLKNKTFSWKDVWWRAYRGHNKGKEPEFWVKRKDGHNLNVFMGSNGKAKMKQKAKEIKKSEFNALGLPPTFYMGDTLIADVNNYYSWGGDAMNKGGFKVRVSAGTDYAFITCLIIIQREMMISSRNRSIAVEAVLGGWI